MIFFCFSSIDRHSIVEAILFHITKYQLPIWYDRQQMLLGDNRNYKNFIEGVDIASYFIIVLSPNSISSTCANEEMELIKEKYNNNAAIVFPLFYNIAIDKIPNKYNWMKQLVYKEIRNDVDVYSACNHIICKVLYDKLIKCKIQSFKYLCDKYSNIPALHYVIEMLNNYASIDDCNYNSKIAILYSLYIYIKNYYDIAFLPGYYYSGIERLFDDIKLNLKREYPKVCVNLQTDVR